MIRVAGAVSRVPATAVRVTQARRAHTVRHRVRRPPHEQVQLRREHSRRRRCPRHLAQAPFDDRGDGGARDTWRRRRFDDRGDGGVRDAAAVAVTASASASASDVARAEATGNRTGKFSRGVSAGPGSVSTHCPRSRERRGSGSRWPCMSGILRGIRSASTSRPLASRSMAVRPFSAKSDLRAVTLEREHVPPVVVGDHRRQEVTSQHTRAD